MAESQPSFSLSVLRLLPSPKSWVNRQLKEDLTSFSPCSPDFWGVFPFFLPFLCRKGAFSLFQMIAFFFLSRDGPSFFLLG